MRSTYIELTIQTVKVVGLKNQKRPDVTRRVSTFIIYALIKLITS